MKNKLQTRAATAPQGQPRSVGAPIKLHKEQFQELMIAMQAVTIVQQQSQSVQQLAQNSVALAQENERLVREQFRAIAKRLGVPEGRITMDSEACTIQRVADSGVET